jgi:hypothetical protein
MLLVNCAEGCASACSSAITRRSRILGDKAQSEGGRGSWRGAGGEELEAQSATVELEMGGASSMESCTSRAERDWSVRGIGSAS